MMRRRQRETLANAVISRSALEYPRAATAPDRANSPPLRPNLQPQPWRRESGSPTAIAGSTCLRKHQALRESPSLVHGRQPAPASGSPHSRTQSAGSTPPRQTEAVVAAGSRRFPIPTVAPRSVLKPTYQASARETRAARLRAAGAIRPGPGPETHRPSGVPISANRRPARDRGDHRL